MISHKTVVCLVAQEYVSFVKWYSGLARFSRGIFNFLKEFLTPGILALFFCFGKPMFGACNLGGEAMEKFFFEIVEGCGKISHLQSVKFAMF